jgi:biopolymer transport protein ExbD/biopolymer transport protein TolR
MGIEVTSSKGPKSEMNVVPLIDVLLVLLILFMVMVPQNSLGLPAVAPAPAEESKAEPPAPTVVVRLAGDGSLYINQEPMQWDRLTGRLEEIFARRADRVAFVQAENRVEFARVARAVSAMQSAGIRQVGLLGANPTGGRQ